MQQKKSDIPFMERAVVLARKGKNVGANPKVGAVLVQNGSIIREGFYQSYGAPHAEQKALGRLRGLTGATLYTTLEPCVWWKGKKTSACTGAIIKSGVGRVVIGSQDPHPMVNGAGIVRIRQAGVSVTIGVAERKARSLNARYYRTHLRKKSARRIRPYVIVSTAMTVDGKIASALRRQTPISTKEDLLRKDEGRSQADAILVGGITLNTEDPSLLVKSQSLQRARARRGQTAQPDKVGISSRIQLSSNGDFLTTGGDTRRFLFTTTKTSGTVLKHLQSRATVFITNQKRYPIRQMLRQLHRAGVRTLMVEGGGELNASLLTAGLVDELHIRMREIILGGATSPTLADGAGLSITRAVHLERLSVVPHADGTVTFHYRVNKA